MANPIEADYDQVHMLPPCIEDWIDASHPARFIRCVVEDLDLGELGFSRRVAGGQGRPGYASELLLRAWLYGYFKKVRSARGLERACREDVGFIWLCGNRAPDHNTLWRFWDANHAALRALFKESVATGCRLGLVGFVVEAVDGTKIQAACHAGKSYDMEDLVERAAWLDAEIAALEKDVEEAGAGGEDAPGGRLPKELRDKRRLREAVAQAREELAADASASHLHPAEREARRVKTKGGKPFGYNAQAVADGENGLVTAAEVTNEPTDNAQLTPMLDQSAANTAAHRGANGLERPRSLADAGYPNAEQIAKAEEAGHNVLMPVNPKSEKGSGEPYHVSKFRYDAGRDMVVCPEGKELRFRRERLIGGKPYRVYRDAAACKGCPAFGLCTRDRHGRTIDISPWRDAAERHREKMAKEENQELLKKRSGTIEPVFAQIKSNGGFWRWTFKGLEKVRTQWAVLCTAWNLKVIYKSWARQLAGANPA